MTVIVRTNIEFSAANFFITAASNKMNRAISRRAQY